MKAKDLYKVDMLGFNSKIGYITNLGTTFYEMQSQYEKNSPEYNELNIRLKLLCCAQNMEIDHSKGIITKDLPKHWIKEQKIDYEKDSKEDIARKEFENKLVIKKRPEFMKFLYKGYSKEYKDFIDDFEKYCYVMFGKKIDELNDEDKSTEEYKKMMEYYNYKNPLLETNGVMNRVCRYMQGQVKEVKKTSKQCDIGRVFEILYNPAIPLIPSLLEKMEEKYKEYTDFKKTKQLKVSDYNTYEQYFKYLRNECLVNISSNLQELANLGVYICYKMFPKKPKDFCWDLFGKGIVENLKETRDYANIPQLDENGDIDYLGDKYKFVKHKVSDDIEAKDDMEDFDDLMVEVSPIDDFEF